MTSLLERWRTETHTFHFPHGETTVTLEDVAVLLGLPIDGDVVTGPTIVQDIFSTFHEHLWVIPPLTVIRGNSIRVSWLNNTFQQLPQNANNNVIAQYARAYILTLIGSILMPDTSAARVHVMYLLKLPDLNVVNNYSWGSAVLACLYRGLDHDIHIRQENIGGCMILLQCWAWERITSIALQLDPLSDEEVAAGDGFPVCRRWMNQANRRNAGFLLVSEFRLKFDQIRTRQFLWRPYIQNEVRRLIVVDIPIVARATIPIICFVTVEFQQADRVMR
ncbi:protein MAIN-LIKE 1-like [Vigna unguiculata]|uniref:protein MAIN-LIKE 1-like n=1 Tax=Vigna unguiculata TaxID=3917 RepID=UPI0010167C67|nr:protein MAIN-LIKE 1-like [Vigna unguiculata]